MLLRYCSMFVDCAMLVNIGVVELLLVMFICMLLSS